MPAAALAEHTPLRREPDRTAYTLRHLEVRAGVQQVGFGVFDQLQLTTHIPIWLGGASLGAWAPNAHLKWMFVDMKGISASVRFGANYLTGKNFITTKQNGLGGDQLKALILPVDASLSWRIDQRFTVSWQGSFSHTFTKGEINIEQLGIQGETAINGFQMSGLFEYRIDEKLELQLLAHYLPYSSDMVVKASTDLDVLTSVDVSVALNSRELELEHAAAGSIAIAYSSGKLELRVGAGYGPYFQHGLGAVLLRPTPYPVFDIYYRY